MYSRPEDPVKYLQNCLARVHDHNLASTIHWSSFLPEPADPLKPGLPGASQPLPPIQPSKDVGVDVTVDIPDVSADTSCLLPNTPLPPIGASSSSDLQKKKVDEGKTGAKVVFVLGGPGSGKGTQCERIVEKYGLSHFSAGDLLRAEVASGSENGKKLEEIMKEGKLVPLDVTLGLIKSAMESAVNVPGFLIDGFPREINQCIEFEKQITLSPIALVLSYDCSEEVMTQRLLERAKTSGRADDNEETIKKRFHTFRESSIPVLNYYNEQQKLKRIDADRTIDEVFVTTCEVMEGVGFEPLRTASSMLLKQPLPPIQTSARDDKVAQSTEGNAILKACKVVFVLGGPGSGKGTQCEQIVKKYNLTHLSTGNLLRDEAASASEKGKQLAQTMEDGKLVPLEAVLDLLQAAMLKAEDSPGFLIDGFPREMNQGLEFEKKITACHLVLSYECSEEVMTQRLLERGKTSGRSDDNVETIKKRFHTFNESTLPVLEYFNEQGKLRKISASRSIDDVFQETCSVLESYGFQPVAQNSLRDAKVVFVLGGPGSGKGTQCERIVERYQLAHFSAGDLLRAEVASGSEQGKQLEKTMKEGKLVPMEVTLGLIRAAMVKAGDCPGFLIDGFPREINQGLEFENTVTSCCLVLAYECSEEVMTQRLLERGKTSGRADDNEETIKKRFHTFKESTVPVLDYYSEQGKLRKVNADQTIDEVFQETCIALEACAFQPVKQHPLNDAKVVFVLGGPGSGKGTQCERIIANYNLTHFSVGDLLRAEVASSSETGKKLEETMKEGKLVPLEVTLGLLEAAMLKASDSHGFLIDGFPREINQGLEFEKKITACHLVLSYECSEEVMTQRLLKRGITSGRADDNEETIKKRFQTFRASTVPVLEYYGSADQGKLRVIDADKAIDEVFQTTCQVLDEAGFQASTESPLKDAKVIFVLGGPGSGKGTQCERIVERYALSHFSAGDLLRAEVASGSEKGKELEETMKEGKLVPLEVTLSLLETAMLKITNSSGFLIDGFPREINQGTEFECKIAPCHLVLSYECSEEVMTQRLLERGKTSGRTDDNEETIMKRFKTFQDSTVPVLNFYSEKGKLRKVGS
jgi:adenylate kinase (isozyme 1 subfamily)